MQRLIWSIGIGMTLGFGVVWTLLGLGPFLAGRFL